jgi:hypothetical protein
VRLLVSLEDQSEISEPYEKFLKVNCIVKDKSHPALRTLSQRSPFLTLGVHSCLDHLAREILDTLLSLSNERRGSNYQCLGFSRVRLTCLPSQSLAVFRKTLKPLIAFHLCSLPLKVSQCLHVLTYVLIPLKWTATTFSYPLWMVRDMEVREKEEENQQAS